MTHPYDGHTFILTGASLGIGRALARELSRSGVNLVLNARGRSELDLTAEECRRSGARADVVAGSAAQPETCRKLVGKAQRLGRFSGLIHAAGVLHPGPFLWEIDEIQAAEVLEANLGAALALIRHVVPALLDREGALIILFGSGVVDLNLPGMGLYSAAKAAEEFLGRHLAVEAEGLTSVVFRPGLVNTRMMEQARNAQGGAGEMMRPRYVAFKEEGRLTEPERPARALMKVLAEPRRFHGRVVTAEELLSPENSGR